ncbi:hypothetical protein J437_LFUL012210 [Ladona fulva]|uniref:Uncharacterized protein n=1 Tax=Ladona fulva TaxID=123851 RepID=A0A8K0KPN1_LADFU|nr:hypothetical protein J437_LFUL012210 [Ladona fulva]
MDLATLKHTKGAKRELSPRSEMVESRIFAGGSIQVNKYVDEPLLSRNSDPLKWWGASKKNTQLKDYVYGVGALLGRGKGIKHASRVAKERICIYLKSEQVVEMFMAMHGGISIQDEFIPARIFQSKVEILLISNVPPEVRNEDLIDLLQQAVTVVSPISKIPMGAEKRVYVMRRDEIVLPDSMIIKLDKTHHRIFLELDKLKYFKCEQAGYLVKNCPKRVEEQTEKSLIAQAQLTATPPSSQSTADRHNKGFAEKASNAMTENQDGNAGKLFDPSFSVFWHFTVHSTTAMNSPVIMSSAGIAVDQLKNRASSSDEARFFAYRVPTARG